ncbi:MAG: RluA family pseudouridine synthase [Planctomycetota bacterium]
MPSNRDLSQHVEELRLNVREYERERLDVYLKDKLGWESRNKIQRLINGGWVRVNKARARVSTRVGRGDEICVRLPASRTPDADAALAHALAVVAEDPYLLAINKPPGLLVHPVGKTTNGTVLSALHRRFAVWRQTGRRDAVPKLCHRLDRETSGLLLVAKTDHCRRTLSDAFEYVGVEKVYLAVVEGAPAQQYFAVDLPIGAALDRHRAQGNRLAQIDAEGQAAHTGFEVVASCPAFSVIQCRPTTGRQNQIRAHLAAAGHPILGDVGFGSSAQFLAGFGAGVEYPRRALLHSLRLRFEHPIWRRPMTLSAGVWSDFAPYLSHLRLPADARFD